MPNTFSFTGQTISGTYQYVVQVRDGLFYDGLGSPLIIGSGSIGPTGPAGPTGSGTLFGNVDGGRAGSVYLISQNINGGTAGS